MTETEKINNVHDKMFFKVFRNMKNTRKFLSIALPDPILRRIALSKLKIDNTRYVSEKFDSLFSDIVVKTTMRAKLGKKKSETIESDIYILLEHKSYRETAILIQLLRYMLMVWEKDLAENKPPRVIIPLVFYHGRESWNMPQCFSDQFDVDEEVKEFLLNYRYILFDTADWNFHDKRNAGLRDNVLLLTAMALMKSAFNEDVESIVEIFKFWHEKGLTKEREKILFFLTYISETKDIAREKLQEILEETKIDGGETMPTLAQRLRQEGMEIGMQKGIEKGIQKGIQKGRQEGMHEGMQKARIETARQMLLDKMSVRMVAKYTGLTQKELKNLLN